MLMLSIEENSLKNFRIQISLIRNLLKMVIAFPESAEILELVLLFDFDWKTTFIQL